MIRLAVLALATVVGTAHAQHTMKLSTSTSGDALVEWLNTFAKGVNASSGGKIKAEVYPASQLGSIPRTIEGVDIAHLGGSETVASLVQFIDGLPFKPGYRRFRIREVPVDGIFA